MISPVSGSMVAWFCSAPNAGVRFAAVDLPDAYDPTAGVMALEEWDVTSTRTARRFW